MWSLGGSYLSQQGNTPDVIGRHGILQEGIGEEVIYVARGAPLIWLASMGLDEGSRGSYLSQQGRSLDLIGRHGFLQDEGSQGSYLSQQGRTPDLIGRHRILQGASTADLIGTHGILQEGVLGRKLFKRTREQP